MAQTGEALAATFGDDEDVRNEGVPGSGLLTPDAYDWPQSLRQMMAAYDPDVVVFLFVGNYRFNSQSPYTTADGHTIESRHDPAFFTAWQAQAERLADLADSAEQVWVLPPP